MDRYILIIKSSWSKMYLMHFQSFKNIVNKGGIKQAINKSINVSLIPKIHFGIKQPPQKNKYLSNYIEPFQSSMSNNHILLIVSVITGVILIQSFLYY